jgi:hypothetical protein
MTKRELLELLKDLPDDAPVVYTNDAPMWGVPMWGQSVQEVESCKFSKISGNIVLE